MFKKLYIKAEEVFRKYSHSSEGGSEKSNSENGNVRLKISEYKGSSKFFKSAESIFRDRSTVNEMEKLGRGLRKIIEDG